MMVECLRWHWFTTLPLIPPPPPKIFTSLVIFPLLPPVILLKYNLSMSWSALKTIDSSLTASIIVNLSLIFKFNIYLCCIMQMIKSQTILTNWKKNWQPLLEYFCNFLCSCFFFIFYRLTIYRYVVTSMSTVVFLLNLMLSVIDPYERKHNHICFTCMYINALNPNNSREKVWNPNLT